MSSSSSILSRLHLETDHICRHSKAYRNTLPVQDRQDLQDTYSENVLFSAQAISAGFRIRGLDTSVEGLIQVAHELCQAVDILSCGLRERALFSIQQPYTDLFDKLKGKPLILETKL